ncbi:hypothetical protein IW261DRAFT_1438635 [Armillaria novae-zelandiae]|uniref:DUF6533 domain-containing protein n=1 Tax=Armillaria novae-zelandiae TaxID=153914 RepID=A0AA39PW08_9AGAR|nr:hypothetical protein IW261DRAFT_1438635 [Armillaria novae-zelandiae]
MFSSACHQCIMMRRAGAAVLILWDHCLTLDEEVAVIWGSFNGKIPTKLVYIVNRYFTEVVMLYTAYVLTGLGGTRTNKECTCVFWLFLISSTVVASISQFFIMMRVYRLWDHKPIVRRILPVLFVACLIGTFVSAVLASLAFLRTRIEVTAPNILVCATTEVPKTIPSAIGILLLFNLLVILVSIYNALENPRRYEGEIFNSLRRDGSRVYLVSSVPFPSVLWVLLLITSLVVEVGIKFDIGCHIEYDAEFSLSLIYALMANLTSRMHLHIESLSDITHPAVTYYTVREG